MKELLHVMVDGQASCVDADVDADLDNLNRPQRPHKP